MQSDLTAQVMATANRRIAKSLWLSGGYRYLYVNYDKDGVLTRLSFHGPLFAATYRF